MVNQHSGQGSPHYGTDPGSDALWVLEMPFFVQRGYCQLILSGVFERHPRLRYILTESGCAWAPGLLRRMDGVHMSMKAGATGEVDFSKSFVLAEPPSFYAKRNCWYGASFPSPHDVAGREVVGVDRILWGNDYPHYEGCYPYSRENMRLAFSQVDEREVRMMLGENAAKLYGFDLAKLRPPPSASASRPRRWRCRSTRSRTRPARPSRWRSTSGRGLAEALKLVRHDQRAWPPLISATWRDDGWARVPKMVRVGIRRVSEGSQPA